jgi:hypothetical protein
MVGGRHPFSSLVFYLDYKSQHKMFILHGQPWGDIVIDHYHWPNIIVGVLEGIQGLTPSMAMLNHRLCTSSLNLSGHVSSICFMAIESVGIHITPWLTSM